MPQQLHNAADVEAMLATPGLTWIYKHSNACGVSHQAYDQVQQFLSLHPDQKVGMVVIQENRPLSNMISTKLKYVHQSPQLFLLSNGQVKWSATHWSITAEAMVAALTAAK